MGVESLRRLTPWCDCCHSSDGRHATSPAKPRTSQRSRHERGPTAVKTSGKTYDDSISDGRYAPALVAYRSEVARAKGLPEPETYETHTTVRDPNEKFTFNFPDVDGHRISNDDPRFKGKVVLAIVTGTWCPNCHDEAQYLVKLDKKYHNKGLAIVALDFEEPEQQGSLARERAFVKQYGVKYTYLIAGAPAEMWKRSLRQSISTPGPPHSSLAETAGSEAFTRASPPRRAASSTASCRRNSPARSRLC